MRRALWIVLAAVIVAMAVPTAHADVITDGSFTFTATFGSPDATGGSFVFDDTTDTYSTFTVNWDGVVFDWTDFSNTLISTTGTWCAAAPDEVASCDDRMSTFSFSNVNDDSFSGSFTNVDGMANGTYTVTETVTTTTPEPGLLGLMLTGIGVLVVLRKRIARGQILGTRR